MTARQAKKQSTQTPVLRIVAFSDYRTQDLGLLHDFVSQMKPKPDLVVYAGDDVERFHVGNRNFFEELASLSTHGLCAVLGNDEGPITKTLRTSIRGTNVYNVHETPLVICNYAVIGSEGSPDVYSEANIARHLRRVAKRVRGKSLIVLSHCPPCGLLDRAIRFGRRAIGSTALRKFLKDGKNIPLVVCGHVHSCGGRAVKRDRTMIVNTASHDDVGAPGKLALIELCAGKVRNVRWEILWELQSVCGVGEKRAELLHKGGIHTPSLLTVAETDHIRQLIRCGPVEALALKRRAAALVENELKVDGAAQFCFGGKNGYIDIETDLAGTFVWLVGLHIGDERRTYSFFADTPAQEREILTSLHEFLDARRELKLLSYSNCKLESRFLSKRFAFYGLPVATVEDIRDIYYDIHMLVAFPVQTTKLKEIARWCGFKSRQPDLDGFAAAIAYGRGGINKRTKQMLLEYNEDDVLSLKHVVRYIECRHPRALEGSGTR